MTPEEVKAWRKGERSRPIAARLPAWQRPLGQAQRVALEGRLAPRALPDPGQRLLGAGEPARAKGVAPWSC